MNPPQSSWLESLRKHGSLAALKGSEFFSRSGDEIESYLNTPQLFTCRDARPRLQSFLRVAHWNIEKGKRFEGILDRLSNNEILKFADVITLNEADFGMIRSGNRHVACEIAESLGMHMVFGPAHFELTKGTDEELSIPGDNRESVQGNAVLSRYPISAARIMPLPVSFEPYEFHEKRYGRRNCVWARIETGASALWVGSVHLELRNTPRCRARQMAWIMEHLPGSDDDAYILGGDLNTNSFARGTTWRTLVSVLRLMFTSPEKMKRSLLHPEFREPLFDLVKEYGFDWDQFNSHDETAKAALDSLEESGYLPGFIAARVKKRLSSYSGYLCFKLDWLFGRNIFPAENSKSCAGVISGENSGPDRISDHLPVFADLEFPGTRKLVLEQREREEG